MSTPNERIEVFQDTLDWIKSDADLAASVEKAKQATIVFYEDDYPVFDAFPKVFRRIVFACTVRPARA